MANHYGELSLFSNMQVIVFIMLGLVGEIVVLVLVVAVILIMMVVMGMVYDGRGGVVDDFKNLSGGKRVSGLHPRSPIK